MPRIENIVEKNIKNGMYTHNLESWEQFVEFVKDPRLSWPTLIYRGHANADWKVESTLDRIEKQYPTTPNPGSSNPSHFNVPRVNRKTHLKRFKEFARGRLTTEIPDSDDEWWALAQHHGLATPMLDWTYSPFVALYFAFEMEKCYCKTELKEPENRAVLALTHHLVLEKAEDASLIPRPFVPTGHANYRLTNQAGLFLRMPDYLLIPDTGEKKINIDLEFYLETHFKNETYEELKAGGKGNLRPRAILQKFIIPNKKRVECLRFLDYMNINRSSLFPDLDGSARYCNDLWEINFDKAVGFVNSPLY